MTCGRHILWEPFLAHCLWLSNEKYGTRLIPQGIGAGLWTLSWIRLTGDGLKHLPSKTVLPVPCSMPPEVFNEHLDYPEAQTVGHLNYSLHTNESSLNLYPLSLSCPDWETKPYWGEEKDGGGGGQKKKDSGVGGRNGQSIGLPWTRGMLPQI